MEEALPLGSSFLDLAIGVADWALRLLPQTRQADPLLYRLSGGGQSCPGLSQKGLGGAGGTRRMFCSPRHFLPTPGAGRRWWGVGIQGASRTGGSKGCNCHCLCSPEAAWLLALYANAE